MATNIDRWRPTFRMGKAAKKKQKNAADEFEEIVMKEKRKKDAIYA
jgi:hypothetical protein